MPPFALYWLRPRASFRKVLAPFPISHVIDSCSLFISFLIFSFFLDFITISVCASRV